ncbi:MAG: CO dehydrogenase/CO-methylating acetyl-CoA synthase complex subunit beta, partial [Methanospirillum sp.]
RFLQAEGGIERLVWIPSALKEELGPRLKAKLAEKGLDDLFDRIATEKEATTIEELMAYLESVDHPALAMKELF